MRFSSPEHKRTRSKRGQRVQSWYKSKKWQRLRREHLDAHPLCQCPHCTSGNMERRSASVVDHIEPHRGSRVLFFDKTNCRSFNKECHDRWKQSEERGGHGFMKGCDASGYPLHPDHHWHEEQ